MDKIQELKRSVLLSGTEDYVGLWEVVRDITDYIMHVQDPREIRDIAITVITELLQEGLMKAGVPGDRRGKFDEWGLSSEDTIKRIESEWDQLGTEPNIGDIVWFNLTPEGEAYARNLQSG